MDGCSKIIGGTGIVAGTTIGASMIALPIASHSLGFTASIALMFCTWLVMFFSAVVSMKLALYFDETLSIVSIAEKILGKYAKYITLLSIVILFYSLLAAYIGGASDILTNRLFCESHIAKNILSLMIAMLLGFLIFRSTKVMDYGNRAMMALKTVCFIAIIGMIVPYIDTEHLSQSGTENILSMENLSLCKVAIPIFFTSFGFHGSITTIVKYLDRNGKAIFLSILVGSFIPVLIYVIWLAGTIGVLPSNGVYSFANVASSGGNVGVFIAQLGSYISSPIFDEFVSYFAVFAILTSFLGVAAGLFDVFLESMNRKNAIFCALTPPLFVSLLIPKAFIAALSFASIALSIIAVIIPSLAAIKLEQCNNRMIYKIALYSSLFFGIAIITIAVVDFIY